jgi:hypothetical protein
MTKHKESIKRDILKNTTPNVEGALVDRIERYEDIIDKISVVDPEFRKYS